PHAEDVTIAHALHAEHVEPGVEPRPDEADAQPFRRLHPFSGRTKVFIRSCDTPSLAFAASPHPIQFGLKTLPTYCRSFQPMADEKNPAAVMSRNRLKNVTPADISGRAFRGKAMSSSTCRRSASVASMNVFPLNRRRHSLSS